jgi:uncharacterized protein (DUF1330 family)
MFKLIKISSLLTFEILLNSCVSENKEVHSTTKNLLEDTPKVSTKQKYIYSMDESWKHCYDKFKGQGKIVMLNLLKFKPTADYTGIEVSNIQKDKTGKETSQYYLKQVRNNIEKTKVGSILYYGESQNFLIGPQNEKWDAVLLIEYDSMDDFVNVIESEAHQKIKGHRKASLEDSRILPASNFNIQEVEK